MEAEGFMGIFWNNNVITEGKIIAEQNMNKYNIPTCNILGVQIAAVNMEWILDYIKINIKQLSGQYICVSNVHTTVMSYDDKEYCEIQNGAIMAIPDGGPLSVIGRRRGYFNMDRVAGPSLMNEIFQVSIQFGYKHYFYGSTNETLCSMVNNIKLKYPDIQIVGQYSPPFRMLSVDEDNEIIRTINKANADFIWIGLGAPKQEKWMSDHKLKLNGLMVGVGAGFDYLSENIKRAPVWMQKNNLEWLYRLIQDPKRLLKRYLETNLKFILYAMIRGR